MAKIFGMKLALKIAMLVIVVSGVSFLAFKMGVQSQASTIKAQKEIYVSECLERWRQNVDAAAKESNSAILMWALNSYANVLTGHLELANTKDWYAHNKKHIIFELGMVHANLGYCYKNMGKDTDAHEEIKIAFEYLSNSQNGSFKELEDIWKFSKSRLFFEPKEIDWGK